MRARTFEILWLLLLVALVILIPVLLKDSKEAIPRDLGIRTLILVSPHNEYIRSEFSRAFRAWYQERNPGQDIYLDWRSVGGTSDVVRYLRSEYFNSFRNYWEKELKRPWSIEVENSFANPAVDPKGAGIGAEARRAFLESNCGIGVDLFFGGGSFEFIRQAAAGFLVDAGVHQRHPEWFSGEMGIPQQVGGEHFWDREGRWYGVVMSSFGIIYNRDSLQRLGITNEPVAWRDLTDPRLLGEVGVADPTKSGSINKTFEIIIQQAMQERMRQLLAEGVANEAAMTRAVQEGWIEGLQILQRMAANARYFTDSANKPAIDVSQGDCAVGMSIDFYGRLQGAVTGERSGAEGDKNRFRFVEPAGGSSYSVDPIGLLRGAPERELAMQFMDFVMSEEGQKIWCFRVGTPGGPHRYELHRSPVSPLLYQEKYLQYRYDPTINPYETAGDFVYYPAWTGRYFRQIAFIVKVALMDVHQELRESWTAIVEAGLPDEAMAVWSDMSAVNYNWVGEELAPLMRTNDPLWQVQEARRLSLHFRDQYKRAERLARAASK